MLIKTLKFTSLGDNRGNLVALETFKTIPFDIKRAYYLFDTRDDVSRGFHAHKNLKQVVISLRGSCRFVLDDGKKRESIVLDSPTTGLLIEGLIWREMHEFSTDNIILVLASEYYDEADYIRNYETFLNIVNGSNKES